MRKATIILASLLLFSLTHGAWAAKKGRLTSPPPSKSNLAAESKGVVQKQTAEQSATRTTTQNAAAQQNGTALLKGTQPTTTSLPAPGSENPEAPSAVPPPVPAYQIPWQSVNGGGGPMSSANYSVNMSVAQAAIGYSSAASYQAGMGYWYGVSATAGCSCPFQSDYDEDGFLTAIDLGKLIDVLFAGAPEITDPDCPKSRGDFDCDGFPTAIDLGLLIDHLFAGGPVPCDPCSP